MTNEMRTELKALVEGDAKKADLQAMADKVGVAYKSKTTKAELIEALSKILETAPVTKAHPTADDCLAKMPEGYNRRVNAKGHILIQNDDGTTICRIRPLKNGMYIFPGKALKATRTDWDYHKGWANEYSLKVATWDEAIAIIEGEA